MASPASLFPTLPLPLTLALALALALAPALTLLLLLTLLPARTLARTPNPNQGAPVIVSNLKLEAGGYYYLLPANAHEPETRSF